MPEINKASMKDQRVPQTVTHNKEEKHIVYCSVQQIADDPSFCFTTPMLRFYILNAHKNGLDKALRRIGRNILIRRDLLIDWIEEQGQRRAR